MARRRASRGQTPVHDRSRMRELSRPRSIAVGRMNEIAKNAEKTLKDRVNSEPDEELEDSELSDWERRQAIARERTRRAGLT